MAVLLSAATMVRGAGTVARRRPGGDGGTTAGSPTDERPVTARKPVIPFALGRPAPRRRSSLVGEQVPVLGMALDVGGHELASGHHPRGWALCCSGARAR